MPDKNMKVFEVMELKSIEGKLAWLLENKSNINAEDLENLHHRMERLFLDKEVSDDVKFDDLSNSYGPFLECISNYLININFQVLDFEILKKWMKLLYDKPNTFNLGYIFTQKMAIPISESVCRNYWEFGTDLSINLIFFTNAAAEKLMIIRSSVYSKFRRLKKLYKLLCVCGDIVMQTGLLKFMVNISTPFEKTEFACSVLFNVPIIESAFVKIYSYNFEDTARYFLDILNKNYNTIFSVQAKYMSINDEEFFMHSDDDDYFYSWLDINVVSKTISLSSNHKNFPENLVSRGNGKVANEFLIIQFDKIVEVKFKTLISYGIEFGCFTITTLNPNRTENQADERLCVKIISLVDVEDLEYDYYPFLQNLCKQNLQLNNF